MTNETCDWNTPPGRGPCWQSEFLFRTIRDYVQNVMPHQGAGQHKSTSQTQPTITVDTLPGVSGVSPNCDFFAKQDYRAAIATTEKLADRQFTDVDVNPQPTCKSMPC